MLLLQGQDLLAGEIPDETMGDTLYPIEQSKTHIDSAVKLYVAEEQLVLKEAYRPFFNHYPAIDTLGLSGDVSDEYLRAALAEQRPDVLMLGLNVASASLGEKLELIRTHYPEMGLVLLFALYDAQGINALRDFSNNTEASYAYLLKHNIDTADQLAQVVNGVAQGRLIVDPEVMEELVENASVESKVLRALSPKELQVLSWMARGFANEAIAGVLYCEKRAVERQISNIYTKLQMGADQKDPRVGAVLMYLAATGQLPQT